MKTIIAGSRDIVDISIIDNAVKQSGFTITKVISGTARGVDRLGEQWAKQNNIEVIQYPADWDKHGRSAGYIRNDLMAKNADALIAIWDGQSKGTKHMIDIATKKGLKVHVHTVTFI